MQPTKPNILLEKNKMNYGCFQTSWYNLQDSQIIIMHTKSPSA